MLASAATFGIRGAIGFKSATSAMNRWYGSCHTKKCKKRELYSPPNKHERSSIIEAMNEFYDKDTVMQDNANPPTKGLAANIECEKQFLNGVKEWKGFNVTATGIGDNDTFYESTMDFIATNGQSVHLEQVSVAKWRNGKIVQERFNYDRGKK